MQLIYNVSFEVTAAIFIVMLLIYVKFQYNTKVRVNHAFETMLFCVLAADVMDVVSAIALSYPTVVPYELNIFLCELYYLSIVFLGYEFMHYFYSLAHIKFQNSIVLKVGLVLVIGFLVVLLINPFYPLVCGIDEQGVFYTGPLHLSVYILPFLFILISVIVGIRKVEMLQRTERKILLIAFFGFFILCALLQYFVFPSVLLTVFSVSVGTVFLLFMLETPDYQKLTETMAELERSRGEAQAASHAKSSFLSMISHEIRTPLNVVMGYDEMIQDETKESATAEYAYHIRKAGRSLLSIISNITDFVELEDATITIAEQVYSTRSLLTDMLTYLQFYNESKGLELQVIIDENLPSRLMGDPVRILQVMNNLTSNAIKYTKEGCVTVQVKWLPKEQGLYFSVEDTGIGIKEDDLEHIAEVFTRFDVEQNTSISGLGLGLAIATRLLDRMHSRLDVTSTYGQGSQFTFTVCQQVEDGTPIGEIQFYIQNLEDLKLAAETGVTIAPEQPEKEKDYQGHRILVVDDNDMNLLVIQKLLESTKIAIDVASNGEEGICKIETTDYDLIFMDHMMPVMDGMEALRIIKEQHLCDGTPVVALTANAVSDIRNAYLKEGFSDYLLKPVTRKELIDCLSKYLEGKDPIDKPAETPLEQEGVLETLGQFLNTHAAMEYCGGIEEFYIEVLQTYLEDDKTQGMIDAYTKKDWKTYGILAHGLKSTSRTIGADALSELAKNMEFAAKEQRVSYLEEHHEDMLSQYSALLGQVKMALGDAAAVPAMESEKEVAEVESVDPIQNIIEGTILDEYLKSGEENPLILVIDDDPVSLAVAKKMLEDTYRIITMDSAVKSTEFLQQTEELPGLILLDIMMPGMSGLEMLSWLNWHGALADIPVIFLTGDENRETEIEALKKGAQDFIHKPFVATVMKERIARVLNLKKLQRILQKEVKKQTAVAEERRQQFERLSTQTMEALADAVDAKDHYTNGHSRRVAEYSREIARRLGRDEDYQNHIYFTGLLHDLGKIGIPDDIIHKDSGLTDEEYEIIKQHPVIGANILRNITEIPDIALGAHWHHERIDGTGYPDHLVGDEIPDAARIIGVADAYDAMTSCRSYRDPLPQDVVREQFEKGRGTQFDAQYTDVMLQMIDEDTEYNMCQKDGRDFALS